VLSGKTARDILEVLSGSLDFRRLLRVQYATVSILVTLMNQTCERDYEHKAEAHSISRSQYSTQQPGRSVFTVRRTHSYEPRNDDWRLR
jgi:hypothetical protein